MTNRLLTALLALALLVPVLLVASGGDPASLGDEVLRAMGGTMVAHASSGSGEMAVDSDLCGCITDFGQVYMSRHTKHGDVEILMPGPAVRGTVHGFLGLGTFDWQATRETQLLNANPTGKERGTIRISPSAPDRGELQCSFRGSLQVERLKCRGHGGKWRKLRGQLAQFTGCAALGTTCKQLGTGPVGMTLTGRLAFSHR